jgi:hypothetical protein
MPVYYTGVNQGPVQHLDQETQGTENDKYLIGNMMAAYMEEIKHAGAFDAQVY